MALRFIVLGNPENRRVTGFVAAAERAGARVELVAWSELLASPAALLGLSDEPALLRIDSWGENQDVQRALLERGAGVPSCYPRRLVVGDRDAREALGDHGRIVAPRQSHDGVLAALRELETLLEARPRWRAPQPIAAIRTLFDKGATQARAAALGIRVPERLPAAETPQELLEGMRRLGLDEVYVKLSCSSSASCLALVEHGPRHTHVITSIELVGERMYNSLRVRRYAKPAQIEQVLAFLLAEGAHIERAIDKLPATGRYADVRLVRVKGAPTFAVLRVSAAPMTNLHLGGTRGDLAAYRSKLPPAAWSEAEAAVERLASALGAWHLGVDVAFERHSKAPYLLEANAFGDLLPGLEHEGRSLYDWEIQGCLAPA